MSNDIVEKLKGLTSYTGNQINAWIGEELFDVVEVDNDNKVNNETPFVLVSIETRDKVIELIEEQRAAIEDMEQRFAYEQQPL